MKWMLTFLLLAATLAQAETFNTRVGTGNDDAEERLSNSTMRLTDSTLDLVYDNRGRSQEVGVRFNNVLVPSGATVTAAYVSFHATGSDNKSGTLTIVGEASDSTATYSSSAMSSFNETSANASWKPGAWSSGSDYQTTDITPIINEIIQRPGWSNGNALSLMFKAGSGCSSNANCRWRAASFNGSSANAPQLHIEYTLPPIPPIMGDVPDRIGYVGVPLDVNISSYVTPTNGDPILGYTLSGNLPSGLSFDSATGMISGTPTTQTTETLTVSAMDVNGISSADQFLLGVEIDLQVNLQMDECYWLGGANGVTNDVKDSSGNGLDAQSRHLADNTATNYKICRAGNFINTYADKSLSDAVFYPNETAPELNIGNNAPFSVSTWVYRHAGGDKWMAAVIKVSNDDWIDGWGLEHRNGSGANIDFFVGNWDVFARATLATDTWTHIVGTYDGSNIRIYKNGVLQQTTPQTSYTAGALAVAIGDDISGSTIDDRWEGNLDEVKIWARALTDAEVLGIYNNESSGLNYDGTIRVCKPCNGADIAANSWELVGIPADDRTAGTALTVNDVFADNMTGALNTDWVVYKRNYSAANNGSSYSALGLSDTLEFGQGYWLGSKYDATWDVAGTTAVDYNSSTNGTAACVSATGKCADIVLVPASKNFDAPDFDTNDGSGNFRNNMTGFIGMLNPVNWADCRLIFDDNGTAYTPSDANASGLANKQIWLYDPADGSSNSSGYTTCADDSPGGCKLVPFKGFWIQLAGKTKGHSVKLVVPEE